MQTLPLRRIFVALFVFLGIFWTQTSFAIDGENTVVIPPGTSSHFFSYGGTTLVSYEAPEHGNLIPASNGFHYEPSQSFWAVGHDVVLIEATLPSGATGTFRYILAAGSLNSANSTVYSTAPDGPGDWDSTAPEVPGTVDPIAYLGDVDSNDSQPAVLSTGSGDTAGHEQTSEHVVNVTVDDLDFRRFPNLDLQDNDFSFYRLRQGLAVILELRARFDFGRSVWQVKPYSENASTMSYIDVTKGFYEVKLVRWGSPTESGADFYINGQHMGSIYDLPFLLNAPVTYEIALDTTPAHEGLQMRFEDPVVTVGDQYNDPSTRRAADSFDGVAGIPSVSQDWDGVEGAPYMSFSPQTLAGLGHQLDINMGAVPHWEHAYLRQDFAEPLTNYKARFWMDTSQLNIPEGHKMRMIYACRDSATHWCVDFRLILTRNAGQLELQLNVWEESTMHTITAPISNDVNLVELQYRTSPSTNVSTGWAELWVNGILEGTVQGLDNHNFKIEDVRIGTNYTSSTVTGTFSMDEIITWSRQ